MDYQYLDQPCRNFCFFKAILLVDPKDKREKVILSSFVAGGTGEVIFLDPETGRGETHVIPGDMGAWALFNYQDEKLLVGTCGTYGYLHCMDLASREWMEPLRVEGISYIWDLAMGSDNMIYGGTYPGCVLLKYDPEAHGLKNLGPMTPDPGNLYSRLVFTPVEGKVYVNCGMSSPCIGIYDIASGEMSNVLPDNVILRAEREYLYLKGPRGEYFVNPSDFKEIPFEKYASDLKTEITDLVSPATHLLKLKSGKTFGIRGQKYFIYSEDTGDLTFHSIPSDPPPTEIFALAADDNGILYGATGLGQTMFTYDPKDGSYKNSDIVTNFGGEVYGIVPHGGKIYMTAYSGGDHIVYDPEIPWSQRDNINPITLESVGPEYIRPQARSILGPDDAIWTGWIAAYGSYGMAITKIDPHTNKITVFKDLVPSQGIGSIAKGDNSIYFTTNGSGNGLETKIEPFYLVKIGLDGKILKKVKFETGDDLKYVYFRGKDIILSILRDFKPLMFVLDKDTLEQREMADSDYTVTCIREGKPGDVIIGASVSGGGIADFALIIADKKTFAEKRRIALPGYSHAYCYNERDGYIYFACQSKLYRAEY